jgi:hypothetical protein
MNTPVSFPLAKVLKEKGFRILPAFKSSYPTISDVVMWLYEKHGIWISVDPDNDIDTWFYTISHGTSTTVFGNYSGPIEAYEGAIEHVLTHLI